MTKLGGPSFESLFQIKDYEIEPESLGTASAVTYARFVWTYVQH